MERRFVFSVDEYYHLYSRGVAQQKVFLDEDDHLRFLALLYAGNARKTIHVSDFGKKKIAEIFACPRGNTLTDIGAYCLMPSHFHLLIREKADTGVTLFARKLLTGYSMYFNKKYQRTGSLFAHPFRAQHVTDDQHLQYLLAYIHLNPVKTIDPESWSGKRITNPPAAKKFLDNYRFSSYHEYVHVKDDPCRAESAIINRAVFPEYFSGPHDFSSFINEWINFDAD